MHWKKALQAQADTVTDLVVDRSRIVQTPLPGRRRLSPSGSRHTCFWSRRRSRPFGRIRNSRRCWRQRVEGPDGEAVRLGAVDVRFANILESTTGDIPELLLRGSPNGGFLMTVFHIYRAEILQP